MEPFDWCDASDSAMLQEHERDVVIRVDRT